MNEQDVFPEEFGTFLLPPEQLTGHLLAAHADLLDIEFWLEVQQKLSRGEVVDVFPYRREARLQRRG